MTHPDFNDEIATLEWLKKHYPKGTDFESAQTGKIFKSSGNFDLNLSDKNSYLNTRGGYIIHKGKLTETPPLILTPEITLLSEIEVGDIVKIVKNDLNHGHTINSTHTVTKKDLCYCYIGTIFVATKTNSDVLLISKSKKKEDTIKPAKLEDIKVGDTVKIISNTTHHNLPIGSIHTIYEIKTDKHCYLKSGHYVARPGVVDVIIVNTHKFEVGDIVEIIANTNASVNKIGDIGTITEIGMSGASKVTVKGRENSDNYSLPSEIKLVSKKGDSVSVPSNVKIEPVLFTYPEFNEPSSKTLSEIPKLKNKLYKPKK
jgi:hypothetical protein